MFVFALFHDCLSQCPGLLTGRQTKMASVLMNANGNQPNSNMENHLYESFSVDTSKIQSFLEEAVSERAEHGSHHCKSQLPDSSPASWALFRLDLGNGIAQRSLLEIRVFFLQVKYGNCS